MIEYFHTNVIYYTNIYNPGLISVGDYLFKSDFTVIFWLIRLLVYEQYVRIFVPNCNLFGVI